MEGLDHMRCLYCCAVTLLCDGSHGQASKRANVSANDRGLCRFTAGAKEDTAACCRSQEDRPTQPVTFAHEMANDFDVAERRK